MKAITPEEELSALAGSRALYRACIDSERVTDATDALRSVEQHLISSGFVLDEEQVRDVFEALREGRSSKREFHVALRQIETRIRSLEFARDFAVTCDPLAAASSIRVHGVDGARYLQLMYGDDQCVLLSSRHAQRQMVLWHPGIPHEVVADQRWFWPLPVARSLAGVLNRSPDHVMSWGSATIVVSAAELRLITPEILSGGLRVRSVIYTWDNKASVVFAINAPSKGDWHARCRALKRLLGDQGVVINGFRYDALGHIPGGGNHFVYAGV